MAVTVKDLARLCGVSIGTVDRAINNRPGIGAATRERILRTAAETGFVKNQNAVTLSSGKSKSIGVIIFHLNSEYFTTLLTAVEAEARGRGYATVIMMSNYDGETEMDCARRLVSMNVAGLVVFSVLTDGGFYRELRAQGTPVVAVGNRIEGLPFAGIDDFCAMRDSVRYVLSRGYRRLLYIAPLLEKGAYQNISAQRARYKGFLAAVEESGLKKTEFSTELSTELSKKFSTELSTAGERGGLSTGFSTDFPRKFSTELSTAGGTLAWKVIGTRAEYEALFAGLGAVVAGSVFVCPSDTYTLRCLSAFREAETKGFRLMGFDRFPVFDALYPKLSGITYSTEEIGRGAVGLLFEKDAADVTVPYAIVPGETV